MNFNVLSGSSSWLAIVGASFFWSWMDHAMFGDALYFALTPSDGDLSRALTLAQLSFIIMLAASVAVFVVCALRARRAPATPWNMKPTVVAAALGFAGNASFPPAPASPRPPWRARSCRVAPWPRSTCHGGASAWRRGPSRP
ncbi:hypothetical protein [Eggerthella sinensis]|uniref:hypothetical protein n=1 Tax=Eggerthella sinensis TaxID=242230 RepID=UPI00266B9813|nr:hypothetical protein [Eggerthella sinensis]